MYTDLFEEFLLSEDTLRVYDEDKLIFHSDRDRLLPLLEYLDTFSPLPEQVTVFDKIVGNAAALLLVIANCREIYSPLGSRLAVKTLEKNGIKYKFKETADYIQQANKVDMCPMEQLSLDKTPNEFHLIMKDLTKQED